MNDSQQTPTILETPEAEKKSLKIGWDKVPKHVEKKPPQPVEDTNKIELERKFLGRLLQPDAKPELERWVKTQKPAIEDFTASYQPLAKYIFSPYHNYKTTLTRSNLLAYMDADTTLKKKTYCAIEALWSILACVDGVKVKSDDMPLLADRIIKAVGTPEGIDHKSLEIAETIAAYHRDPTQSYKLDHVIDLANKLKYANRPTLASRIQSAKPLDQQLPEPMVMVDGLLRKRDVASLNSGPKMRKSYAVQDLAICCVNGLKWLGHFQCQQAKVLVIDNELSEWQFRKRAESIAAHKKVKDLIYPDFVCLREFGLQDLCSLVEEQVKGYDLIVIDALYRFFPAGFNENDNAAWTVLLNTLETWARKNDTAILYVHHTSKGDQSMKSTTDSGSGGGAQSRAVDAHIVLKAVQPKGKPAEDAPEHATLSAVLRSFKPLDKVHLRWQYPVWTKEEAPVEEEDQKLETCRGFAQLYSSDKWEPRADIENRAREAGYTLRDARESFSGSVAAGWIQESVGEGKSRKKLYKLDAKTITQNNPDFN